jgi:outer membrane protein TolC
MLSNKLRLIAWMACASMSLIAMPGIGRGDPPLPVGAKGIQVIDLGSALKLAGVDNPDILLARQRVALSLAQRQYAAAQFLPTLNAGLNYDAHTGPLQRDTGVILEVNRNALYIGAGANAVAAGTVTVPGIGYNLNVSETIFGFLVSRQEVSRRRYSETARTNEMLRRVASAYLDLLRAEGVRSVTLQARNESQAVAQITKAYADVKIGRQADADRAATEADNRRIDHIEAEANTLKASARLAELLNIPPSIRLHPVEERLVPLPIVPDPVPITELLAIAMMQRPELAERRVAIRQALLELSAANVLPFSPNVIVGQSGGVFGGGSNLATTPQGSFDNRDDLDVIVYWTLHNMGLGNVDLQRIAASHTRSSKLEHLDVLNRVRSEVAQTYERKLTYYDKMLFAEEAVPIGVRAFTKDFERIRQMIGLPIELLESFQLLNQARFDLLDAIVQYNQAQVDLYVALGQPPIDMFARPVPTSGIAPTSVKRK